MSKENEVNDKEQDEVNEATADTTDNDQKIDSESTLEEKYNELNDKFLRLYAEFDNYRRRTSKEKADIIANANEKLLLDLIPTLDDFERAIENNKGVNDPTVLKDGFELIYNKLRSTLEAKGLKQMNAKGETFDSDLHEAIANIPGEENQKGKVIDDVEKGYHLHDKVIRFAKVVVGQ